MKKILTVLTAVLLLCGMVFSMASCGKVDMADLKTKIEELDKNDENITATCTDETGEKDRIKVYRVSMKTGEEYEYITITEYANSKIAKLMYKGQKAYNDYEADALKLQEDLNEEYKEIGKEVEELEETYEKVLKLKGTVVISGSKAIYEKLF